MKKILSIILCLSLSAAFLIAARNASADEITVELDGKKIEFDVKPEIIDGRTMVPLRKIFEEIGANVKWNSDTQTVSARKGSKTITLSVNSADLQIDKGKTDSDGNPIAETVTLEVPAQIVDGRTLVPVRAISESFGLNVDWDKDNQKVSITSDDDEDDSWKENTASINLDDLTYEGEGIEIAGNQIKITSGGDFTVSGTLADGNITISAEEKVKLRLNGAEITSSNNPCIFVEKADKAYITLCENTENVLVAKNSEDGAIYSKENLEIKGDGSILINSQAGQGIKASDNINIENGSITINAASDGIHINDTFKMTGGKLDITADGDGIDCESIVNIFDGTINIKTEGTPVRATQAEESAANDAHRRGMSEEKNDVEFEKSTKGINAEWMMVISGGVIDINSASHAIHCQDEIEINGASFTLYSEYGKGISAHGNVTVNGTDTVIDVVKSTEGIESKNILTINDGTINIVSSDDAINATGGNGGDMMPGGGEFAPPQMSENQTDENKKNPDMPEPPSRNDRNGEFQEPPEMPQGGTGALPPQMSDERTNDEGERKRPQMNGGAQGGMGRDMKDCLVINGGYIELYAGDDCLDSNGNLIINGGTIKAVNPTGSFAGSFAVIDPEGQTVISENATLIFAAQNGSERNLNLMQNNITVYCDATHSANDKIEVKTSSGDVLYEYTPAGEYRSVLIASGKLSVGENYIVTMGSESHAVTLSEQSVTAGTQQKQGANGGMNFGKRPGMQ